MFVCACVRCGRRDKHLIILELGTSVTGENCFGGLLCRRRTFLRYFVLGCFLPGRFLVRWQFFGGFLSGAFNLEPFGGTGHGLPALKDNHIWSAMRASR